MVKEQKPKAILFGPFVGEMYWEAGRFAPLLAKMVRETNKGKDITYIVLTREERFDLYGKHADVLVPLRIENDYCDRRMPNCFRLNDFKEVEYINLVRKFKKKYKAQYQIIRHVYPQVDKKNFLNKNQFPRNDMLFKFSPRDDNYKLVNEYLPNHRPLIVIASRFRKGFKRNWHRWEDFYDMLYADKDMMERYNFIICGKPGEYVPDPKKRFYDMNDIQLTSNSSLIGLLLVILERAFFTVGSQSAIPNLSLLYKVEVLEFGCQKAYHTRTYNVFNSRITFIENRKYNIETGVLLNHLKTLANKKYKREKWNERNKN